MKVDHNESYDDYVCYACNGSGKIGSDPEDSLDTTTIQPPGPITTWLLRLALAAGTYILFQIIFK